jgi:hypothetical protein
MAKNAYFLYIIFVKDKNNYSLNQIKHVCINIFDG